MTDDDDEYYAGMLADFISTSRDLREFLQVLEEYLERARRRLANGDDLFVDLDDQTPRDLRDRFYARMKAAEDAMTRIRAEGTRRIVDDLGITLTRVAGMTNRSRQFTTRLYRTGVQRRQEARDQVAGSKTSP
jgi:hypothetical protein